MTRGKETCKILKEIRQEIANRNDIEYITSECHFKGECKGTCPKCEAELRYLEHELKKRQQLGKAVAIAGISLGMAGTLAACNAPKQHDSIPAVEQSAGTVEHPSETVELEGEIAVPVECNKIDNIQQVISNTVGYIPSVIVDSVKRKEETDKIEITLGEIDSETHNAVLMGYVPEMPTFPGGPSELTKFIQANLQYPEEAVVAGVHGTVVVQFVVEPDGSLTDFKVIRKVATALDAEALRIAESMPAWLPGRQNGENVRMAFKLPIQFKLEK